MRLWQVDFKMEDRDRLGPRLYLHGQPKFFCEKRSSEHKMMHNSKRTTSINASKTTGMENFLRSLDRRHRITT